uniref:B1160F02.16 protein n=2 Tax=Oryza sativa TaxID=4530 RepID=Q6MWG0_ORYSJ|nr:B1160F02.16 [Oryza sativa Japonica Group]
MEQGGPCDGLCRFRIHLGMRGDCPLPAGDGVDAMVGNRIWFGGLFTSSGRRRQINAEKTFELSPVQEALRALWSASFPDAELSSLISEQWKDMGWQGPNPSTDFRGCGFVGLENLLFFATTYPASYQRLLLKKQGMRATWEYPFAVAGVNVSYMLIQLLELNAERPKSLPGINFIKVLSEHEEAFDVLYCIAFEMMDAQWLAMRASYMQFKDVLEATKQQLERELSLEDVNGIRDIPAYNLLYK